MNQTNFLDRRISLTFVLGDKFGARTFASTGTNTLVVSDARVKCSITDAGGPTMGNALVRVYGLTPSNLRDLCTTQKLVNGAAKIQPNYLTISVGDSSIPVTSYSAIFQGQITVATIDMDNAPETMLTCTCNSGGFESAYQVPPHTYFGGVDVYTIMQSLANLSPPPLNFEGNNTHVQLHQQYLWGSLRDQIKQAAEAAGINWTIANGTLAIWPQGGARTSNPNVPRLSYQDGTLIGYPVNWSFGAGFKCIFNSQIFVGTLVNCTSTLDFATGQFSVADVAHEIDSMSPSGQWFTMFHANPVPPV